MHFSIDRTVHTTAFDKPVVDHWLERKITQTAAGSTEKDRSDDRPLQRRARYRLSYIPLPLLTDSQQVAVTAVGCSPPNSMLSGRRSRCTPTFDTAFYKIFNAIGDIMFEDLQS